MGPRRQTARTALTLKRSGSAGINQLRKTAFMGGAEVQPADVEDSEDVVPFLCHCASPTHTQIEVLDVAPALGTRVGTGTTAGPTPSSG